MSSELFFSFMTSLLICMAPIPPLGLLASRLQIVDQPGERKVHQIPVPTVGGIAFALGAFVSILWWVPKNSTTLGVLLGGLIILGFGVWDDRANLGYRIKLLGQVAAALAVVIIGGIRFESIPFLLDAELPMWIGIPVTEFFVVAVSNAVNLTDGLDGLAGGLSFLTLCGIAYLAYLSNNSTVLLLTVPFLGGVLGFLRRHPSGSDFHGRRWQSVARLYHGRAGHPPDRFDQRAVQPSLVTLSFRVAISGYAWCGRTTIGRRTFPLYWRSQTCAPQADDGRLVPL